MRFDTKIEVNMSPNRSVMGIKIVFTSKRRNETKKMMMKMRQKSSYFRSHPGYFSAKEKMLWIRRYIHKRYDLGILFPLYVMIYIKYIN